MERHSQFQQLIEKGLKDLQLDKKPIELYEPIRYMLQLGGKRLRPALVLMSHDLFGGNPEKVIKPALGIEVFHNFTLLHDDIMDKAPLRRKQQTVHEKWNNDIAILSGDTMFVRACQLMSSVEIQHLPAVLNIFFKTSIEVCEGQQLDMNFEKEPIVTIDQYLEMISLKTAVLLGCALAVGAICANASPADTNHLYQFGKQLGIAFQLHDDILDVYGDSEKFGKQIGGDILSNKKTFLMISAKEQAQDELALELNKWTQPGTFDQKEKVNAVVDIFNKLSVREQAESKMNELFSDALSHLQLVQVPSERKKLLTDFAEQLMVRTS